MGELLESLSETEEAESHFEKAVSIYSSLNPGDDRKKEDLEERDFDEMISFWSR